MPERLYKVAFASLKGMTCRFGRDMLGHLGSEELFFTASTSQLKSVLGFDNKILEKGYREEVLEKAKRECEFIDHHNIKTFYFNSPDYPARLLECDDAPAILYGIGNECFNAAHVISIVGTRHATVYGIGFVKELVEALARQLDDVAVISGLAYGIDVSAHKESLKNGVPTIGVLAHGLDSIYPAAHRNVAATIVKSNGMLLTEYGHDSPVHRGNFLARNRIVAGLADCTLVVESAEKGGAMITARIASGYNRDVFALPGRITDQYSRGCNRLISTNVASLVQTPEDLMTLMGWEMKNKGTEDVKLFYQPTPEEQKILDFLTKNGEGFINRISVETGMPIHRLMGLLVDMEFKGLIVNQPGGMYCLKV